ncbi:hypothetical protein J6590_107436, partial [Homalodisca vitripennis]
GPGSRCPSPRAAGRNLCPQGRPAAGGVGGLPATRTEQGGRMGGSPRGVGGATSLQFPKTPREIDSRKRRLKEEARLAWQAQVSQCVGVTDCRRCHSKPETLGHVIVVCIAGKRARIERHNWVVAGIEPFSVGSSHSTHHRGPTQAI